MTLDPVWLHSDKGGHLGRLFNQSLGLLSERHKEGPVVPLPSIEGKGLLCVNFEKPRENRNEQAM